MHRRSQPAGAAPLEAPKGSKAVVLEFEEPVGILNGSLLDARYESKAAKSFPLVVRTARPFG